MLKDALSYLVSLKQNKTYEIGGRTYADQKLCLIEEPQARPAPVSKVTLSSLVSLIKKEEKYFVTPTFVSVADHRRVEVVSSYDVINGYGRDHYYTVLCDASEFVPGWFEREDAIVKLMSIFEPTDDREYVINLISQMTQNSSVESSDNGITQKVVTRTGVDLKQGVTIKPFVSLKPFRTFLEVDQPESKFLLRVGERCKIGLLEADGGKWVIDAKANIKAYFERELKELVSAGSIVVLA